MSAEIDPNAWTLLTLSAPLCLVALVTALVRWRFVATSARATGRVVELVRKRGARHGGWYPVVEFPLPDGSTRTIHGSVYSAARSYEVGQPVDVLYAPRDPARAKIDRALELYFVPIVFGGIGVGFGVVGAILALALPPP